MMDRRARSAPRLFSQDPYIYDRPNTGTKLFIRRPSIRASTVGPDGRFDGPSLRRRISASVPPTLRAYNPYRPYGLIDIDYYDRFNERLHKPLSQYGRAFPSDTFVTRYLISMDRVGRIHDRMKEFDYMRNLRTLRLRTPTNIYRWSGSPYEWLGWSRRAVHDTLHPRSSLSNARDYYGRSYISMEKSNANRVRSRFNYIGRNVEQRPSAWNAEDQIETGQNLLDLNFKTLPQIYSTMNVVDNSRDDLLMDKTGIVPRFHHMTSDFTRAKFITDHSKRILSDFKRFKDDVMGRLATPWHISQFSS